MLSLLFSHSDNETRRWTVSVGWSRLIGLVSPRWRYRALNLSYTTPTTISVCLFIECCLLMWWDFGSIWTLLSKYFERIFLLFYVWWCDIDISTLLQWNIWRKYQVLEIHSIVSQIPMSKSTAAYTFLQPGYFLSFKRLSNSLWRILWRSIITMIFMLICNTW